jgi:hypothetical protein
LTAFYLHESRMNIDFSGFDKLHHLGEGATHWPALCSVRHAAQANSRDTTRVLLRFALAWLSRNGTLKRVQLSFLGL